LCAFVGVAAWSKLRSSLSQMNVEALLCTCSRIRKHLICPGTSVRQSRASSVFSSSPSFMGARVASNPYFTKNFLYTFNQHFFKIFSSHYSTVQFHPSSTSPTPSVKNLSLKNETNVPSPPLDVEKVINAVQETLKEEEITQETMLLPASAFQPLPDSFAVVWVSGRQFKVTSGDEIMVNKLYGVEIQNEILLDKVLLLGTKEFTVIGKPLLTKVKVLTTVEEISKTKKVWVFKKKRRKGYRRLRGARHPYTLLKVQAILIPKFDTTNEALRSQEKKTSQ
jgi:ribosomal protein L21